MNKKKIVKIIKEKIIKNEISDKDFKFVKLNANLFKSIRFVKNRRPQS